MKPTPQQLSAIDCVQRQICIIAGPGSGKTATLKERVLRRNLPAKEVVLLTFTNAGANEMRHRLGDYKPRFVGTLHKFCFMLMQQFGNLIGYRNGTIAIVDEETRDAMLDEIVAELGMKKRLTKTALMKRIGPDAELVWKQLHFRLKQDNTTTYDGILDAGLALIQTKEAQEAWRVIDLYLDEAQDSSDVDWKIIKAFPAMNLFIIGDPDQSIFAFRGGRPELLTEFFNDPKTTPMLLEDNFRSDIDICVIANSLIAKNTNRVQKCLRWTSEEEGKITVDNHTDDNAEIRWLISRLQEEPNPNEVAVLSRLNKITNEARYACKQAGIKINEPPKKFSEVEWNKVLSLVGLMLDRGSNLLAEKFLRCSMRATDVARMKLQAMAGGRTLNDVAAILPHRDNTPLLDVPQILAKKGVGMEEAELVASRIGLHESIAELLHDLWNRAEWIERITSGVTFSTIHGAKGREWNSVYVLGMEEGVLPMLRENTPVEEERRLAFVAFTRARHSLSLSWAKKRSREFGPPVYAEPSRFINEAL